VKKTTAIYKALNTDSTNYTTNIILDHDMCHVTRLRCELVSTIKHQCHIQGLAVSTRTDGAVFYVPANTV